MNRCVFYRMAIEQRRTELARGEGFRGTMGYELQGCYDDCKGEDRTRKCYTQLNLEEVQNERQLGDL